MIVGLLRIKNVEKWIKRLIIQLDKVCDKILILDDGSTDRTFQEIANAIIKPKRVRIRKQEIPFHGGRDRIMLHKWAAEFNPTWIVAPDGDELWEEGKEEELKTLLLNTPEYIEAWTFPFFYLWDDENHYRDDGSYHNVTAVRAFRYNKDELPKDSSSHSVALPKVIVERRRIKQADIRMKHFGYMEKGDRIVRYNYYTDRDKDPKKVGAGSGDYKHIIAEKGVGLKKWGDWKSEENKVYISPRNTFGGGYKYYKVGEPLDLTVYKDKVLTEVIIEDLFDKFNMEEVKMVVSELHRVIKTTGILDIKTTHNFEEMKDVLINTFFGDIKYGDGKEGEIYITCLNGA